jgi:hypothetical protein
MALEVAGVTAVNEEVDDTETLVAAIPPIRTEVRPGKKPVPAIVTAVPPTDGPVLGVMEVVVGAVVMSWYSSAMESVETAVSRSTVTECDRDEELAKPTSYLEGATKVI